MAGGSDLAGFLLYAPTAPKIVEYGNIHKDANEVSGMSRSCGNHSYVSCKILRITILLCFGILYFSQLGVNGQKQVEKESSENMESSWDIFFSKVEIMSKYQSVSKLISEFLQILFQRCHPYFERLLFLSAPEIHVAIVVCGEDDRVQEALVNIKSIMMFTKAFVKFHIFTEETLKIKFENVLTKWPPSVQSRFEFDLHLVTYPNDGHAASWKKLFKLCASQRLFLPDLLSDVDSILYVDTDVLFLSPVENLWSLLSRFNATQLSSMAEEHESTNVAWYNRFARHPYYGKTGINSGVMLVNMTRMRRATFKNDLELKALGWNDMLLPLFRKYRLNMTYGDQDLLNIIFHYNPEMLMTFPCKWNYRPDHCMYSPVCQSANRDGAQVLHGCRRAFQKGSKWPSFAAIYKAVESFDFEGDHALLLQMAKEKLKEVPDTNCKKASRVFLNPLQKFAQANKEDL